MLRWFRPVAEPRNQVLILRSGRRPRLEGWQRARVGLHGSRRRFAPPHHEGIERWLGRRRTTMLSPDELERYARHIVLRDVGGPGQAALKRSSVLVIGAGGLGAPALMYLAAAGVGTLGVVDDDVVSLSNLQRQVIHTTPDIGRHKVESSAERIAALNPHVRFVGHATW